MQTLWQDLRYGARMLLKKPGFTLIAIVTLALGIGANTAIFSAVNAVLLRPLPYDQPERLVALYTALPKLGYPRDGLTEAEFIRLRQENRSFAELAGWYMFERSTLRGVSEPERVAAPFCTANFFRTLGVKVALGRDFNAEEEVEGKNKFVVLSHAFWQRKFAGDPAVIGRTLDLDDSGYTVVGVLPASFKAPMELRADTRADLWRAIDLRLASPRRGNGYLGVIGRLQPGATLAQAQAEHQANNRREAIENPKWYPPEIIGYILPLERAVAGDARLALLILLGAVVVVLLIACVNVANLLLVRGEDRQKEIAVRAALGASRGRIVRQLLMESSLLAALGGGLGLLLAVWGVDALLRISPADIPRLAETSLDLRVTGFALLMSLLTAALFGLVPALRAVKFDLHTTLKEGGRSEAANSRSRLRRSLVVLETALAVVLLIGAGLLIRSVRELQRVDMGFRSDHLLTMRMTPPNSAYPDNQRIAGLYERLLARINALPGVESAAVTDPLPPNGEDHATVVEIEGRQFDMNNLTHMSVDFRTVSAGYFQAMGMRLLRGRLFTGADQEGATPVAIVNESFARNHWPSEDPVGKRFRYLNTIPDRARTRYLTIVGVVADAKNRAFADAAWQEAFIPLAQHAVTYGKEGVQRAFNLVARTMADPSILATTAQREAREIEPDFIISQVRTMDDALDAAFTQPRFNMILFGGFALLALALGAVGIYGVIAYAVAQRTHEIGVRMALGAQSHDVLKLVVAEGMLLAASGVGIGLLASFALTRLMKTLLFGVSATDPLTFGSIPLLLTAVALLACYVPARRAAKVDPMIALRCE
ncbi:MAG TPA: ABC transporter permease [Blastocatellia bacterium]|jgi:putative ABC transport system permease protein|nr:ABC transporter permease [Blastocatellia bacterium]